LKSSVCYPVILSRLAGRAASEPPSPVPGSEVRRIPRRLRGEASLIAVVLYDGFAYMCAQVPANHVRRRFEAAQKRLRRSASPGWSSEIREQISHTDECWRASNRSPVRSSSPNRC
jgi:hypothetical protein